ncbi:hypothetical protein BC827DRAFT_197145 [Russula dissimulans]|nr:hypothetical protein BC827DRAFT_197145 [Russula dissimulans]
MVAGSRRPEVRLAPVRALRPCSSARFLPAFSDSQCDVLPSIRQSYLWQFVTVLHLTTNMRIDADLDRDRFARWLLDIANGRSLLDSPSSSPNESYYPPSQRNPFSIRRSFAALSPHALRRLLPELCHSCTT